MKVEKRLRTSRLLQGLGVVIFIGIVFTVDWHDILLLLSRVNCYRFALAVVLVLPFLGTKVWRWIYLLKLQGISYSYSKAVSAYLSGVFLGLATPGKAGDLVKVVYLKQDLGIPLGRGLSSVLVDRLCDVLFSVLVGGLGIVILGVPFKFGILFLAGGLILAGVFGIVLGKSIVSKLPTVAFRTTFLSRLERSNPRHFWGDFCQGCKDLLDIKIVIPFSLSLLAYFLLILSAYLLAKSLNIPLDLFGIAFCITIANLVALLPISIFGLGTREGAMILLFSMFGLSRELAIVFSLMFLVANNVPAALVGALAWIRHPADIGLLFVYRNSEAAS